ncbi:MAG: calcium-translocating P-type ATPase, PMCA-type [Clostridiales bacterium]|nr:calcium-translocating P-type ATPase, PMCA-type [Clostridiales bacterium]
MQHVANESKTVPSGYGGLTAEQVAAARKRHGENRLTTKKRTGFLAGYVQSFGDPMIKILLVALAINLIFLTRHSNWFESIGIAFAILLATLVSTISEYGSEAAFEKLQEEASQIRCRVRRAEGVKELPMEEIVVGDLVLLQPGERVPADGCLLEGRLEVDQSALNGESKEAQKHPRAGGRGEPPGEGFLAPERLFSGSIVCGGEGLMRVNAVGDLTVYGRIGAEIQQEARESPLRHRLNGLAAGIGRFGYLAAGFSALAFLFNNLLIDNGFHPALIKAALTSWPQLFPLLLQACMLAVTVVVMAVPEGLPMMITVVLSANMRRMIRDNVLVRKLIGIETAGSMNLLFTDKTGTLTGGRLTVTEFVDGAGKTWDSAELARSGLPLHGLLKDCLRYNTSAVLEGKRAIGGNATDRAVLEFARSLQGGQDGLQSATLLPFSSEEKRMVSAVSGAWTATLVKGAPEKILPHCTTFVDPAGRVRPLGARLQVERALERYAAQSMRVIAVAVGEAGSKDPRALGALRLVGLLAIRDSLRPGTRKGVEQMQQAGIQTVMITGDAQATAVAVAREAGILRSDRERVISHDEMSRIDDAALAQLLPDIRVVARALPSDKSRLVRVAQAMNLVVGMTGDGVNDAPALKQADVGFAMGSGTEVAKEAGDIVILDDHFDSIAKAVLYGRTIFHSIRKFIIYQMSICLCAVGVTVIGPLIKVDFPITVIQMLWINIVMDTLAGLAFSGERARAEYMRELPKRRDEPIVSPEMMGQIATGSLYATALCLWFLRSAFFGRIVGEYGQTYGLTAFFELFMFCAIFNSFNARTSRLNLLSHLAANKSFIGLMGTVALVQVLIPFFGGPLFRTVPIYAKDMAVLALLAFSVIPVDLLRKLLIRWGAARPAKGQPAAPLRRPRKGAPPARQGARP